MSNEEIISDFMRAHYTDEKLAALLAHAEDGKLSFDSCCCFIGVATADHALQGRGDYYIGDGGPDHFDRAEMLEGAPDAEQAFLELSAQQGKRGDAQRRKRIIPLIRAEIERRERERSESSSLSLQSVSV